MQIKIALSTNRMLVNFINLKESRKKQSHSIPNRLVPHVGHIIRPLQTAHRPTGDLSLVRSWPQR